MKFFGYDDMHFNKETLQAETDFYEEIDPESYWAKGYSVLREGCVRLINEQNERISQLERALKEACRFINNTREDRPISDEVTKSNKKCEENGTDDCSNYWFDYFMNKVKEDL